MELFKGRPLIIATKHNKEKVIAPLLNHNIGVRCFVDHTFDTDVLGTFSGEIKRELDPIATARKKCLAAMEQNNCDLGVASEGSFGPHPSLFFASADDEFVIFIDKKHNLEIIAREISTETNFNGKTITSFKDLLAFAELTKFPTHRLILKTSKDNVDGICKGITSFNDLKKAYNHIFETHGSAYVETDMRAMYNPSRMLVIKRATQKLVDKIKSKCPKCQTPGFDISETISGLPCELCASPTNAIKRLVYQCKSCKYTEERPPTHGKVYEDPMYCNYCNP